MPSQTSDSKENLVPFAQLWPEEQVELAALAAKVPAGGTVVEIGCAQGGSATILDRATNQDARTSIFSIDQRPSPSAKERLRHSRVTLLEVSSITAAASWHQSGRGKVDLILIDGDHSFSGILSDFEKWREHLHAASTLLFHDVDAVARGGCAHFAIRVFIETLVRERWLVDSRHQFRFVSGRLGENVPSVLPAAKFIATLDDIRGQCLKTIGPCLETPIADLWKQLSELPRDLTSLDVCYIVDRLLEDQYYFLHDHALNVGEFRKWTEALWLLGHGCGKFQYPHHITLSPTASCEELSHFLAREQVRISLLVLVVRSLFSWQP